MSANGQQVENELVSFAIDWLRQRLPAAWQVALRETPGVDAVIGIHSPNSNATLAVEAKRSFTPRQIDQLLGSVGRTVRAIVPGIAIIVLAPWLSPRARALLEAERINYLDRTGNAFLQLDSPAVFIRTDGATRDPAPPSRGSARVRGAKAGRLIRFLVDVQPPYGVREIATETGLTPGYVSRLLTSLDEAALVERSRGVVTDVEIEALLRRWTEHYDVLKTNQAATYIAPQGAASLLDRLGGSGATITGSFAAVRWAPVAQPALLCVYTDDRRGLERQLALLPSDAGADVALLEPYDPVVAERTVEANGLTYVSPSQAAIDCLTGTGRMPAEGEALLAWMLEDQSAWRSPSTRLDDAR